MTTSIWFWIAFHIGVFIAIGIDLFASKRRGRELSMRAAFQRTVIWVLVSLAFNVVVWRLKGPHHALDFLTGYLIEYSLSMDNIFVFVLIFTHFRVRVDGRWMLTPLALTMIVIETTDLIFAVDSIPAVLAITQDQFVAYTSNICAILGLRSLYFLLAGLMDRFVYLRTGLAFVLGFVGIKMILVDYFPIPRSLSLGIIVVILTLTIGISMLKTQNQVAGEDRK